MQSAHAAKFFGANLSSSFLSLHTDSATKIVTVGLIVFMSATTFTTQRQLMTKGMPKMDASNNMMLQQQKIMLYVFPIIFAISGVNFPVGVLIYWSTTNLWTLGQQFYVIKRNPTPGSPAYEELQKKKAAKAGANPELSTGSDSSTTVVEDAPRQRQQPTRPSKKKKKK